MSIEVSRTPAFTCTVSRKLRCGVLCMAATGGSVWIGGLEPQVTEEILWELFVQCGPVVALNMPRDKITNLHQGFAFCEYNSPEDADYAIRIMNMVRLYGKPIRVNKASKEAKEQDIGANLFIGNIDADVDDRMLYEAFAAFGNVLQAKVMNDPDSGEHRGFAFVSYDDFDAADAAIASMNGQYICNKPLSVSYAYKKDGTKGERHGTPAERMLAAKGKASRPNTGSVGMKAPVTGTMGMQQRAMLLQQVGQPLGGGMGGGMGGLPGLPGLGMMRGMGMPGFGMPMGMPPMPGMMMPGMPPMPPMMPPPPPPQAMFGGAGPTVHPSRMEQVPGMMPPGGVMPGHM